MIELKNVAITAGGFQLERIELTVPTGAYAVLMGRTGRGKTTLLEAICGLRKISSGQILIDGTDVTSWAPGDREVGYVPQDLALFPTLNVAEHLAFALKLRRWGVKQINDRIEELATVLGIESLLNRGVANLSGGESQRVALGRALSFRPTVLLLDEPLSALDETTRGEIQTLLLRLKQSVTILHVTHNREEAMVLGDHHFRLDDGRLIEAVLEH
ncbi:ABC transporter ATP-binding protein [Rhodopirellula sp. MGV]|uniref:ABC transporter ATP-binding protein n=1 Tax=Rhodopirellula sp. MGV TaxID=2023130 RepID=UPI000B95DCBB|nr:ABC transporter ATP-binding protein [Rhodopirellula sp. MGV]OYP36328.1 ABC transporter ATP-binding protein [Rhodopirellula sp. MGV]PNY38438.1 ABC transporter ATP-binding protein [Rhodopirellula baltica]